MPKKTPARTPSTSSTRAIGESGTLARGLMLLAAMNEAARPLSLSELGEACGLPASTCHRLLQTLLQTGHVYRSDASRYCPGPRAVFPLALDHPMNLLRRDAAGLLQNLQKGYEASAMLIAFLGSERVVVDYVAGRGSVVPYFDTYVNAPLHASVSGKLLLCGVDRATREQWLGARRLEARTRHTVVDRAALHKELARVAERGWASNDNENVTGISALGVRLLSPSGVALGALVLTGLAEYFTEEGRPAMLESLQQSAQMLSTASQSVRAVAKLLSL